MPPNSKKKKKKRNPKPGCDFLLLYDDPMSYHQSLYNTSLFFKNFFIYLQSKSNLFTTETNIRYSSYY